MTVLGRGLDGPPCPQRASLNQTNPPGLVVQKMCIRCGRVTSRVGDDNLPWCGGSQQMDAGHNQPRYSDTRRARRAPHRAPNTPTRGVSPTPNPQRTTQRATADEKG